ncbi:MAG: hypothetical protein EA359_09830, partial [Balneolaceae bacterium]
GGKLGRPGGSTESDRKFLDKETSVEIQKYLEKGFTVREITKVVGSSPNTVVKVKKLVNSQTN